MLAVFAFVLLVLYPFYSYLHCLIEQKMYNFSFFFFFHPQEGLNILHCAAINNHTEIVEYIVNDLQMKELDKEDRVSTWL